jgi:hypothetical protein
MASRGVSGWSFGDLIVMNAFVIVHLDLSTGRRSEFPERFRTQVEAAARIAELTLTHPQQVYVMKLIPAA